MKLRTSTDCDDTDDTVLINSSDHLNGSPTDSSLGMKQNGARSPRKRRRNGEVEGNAKKIHPPEKVPPEILRDQPPCYFDGKLSFLDRLVNHPGSIPLPFK